MIKLSKFCILCVCTAICLTGCGKQQKPPVAENIPEQTVEEKVEETVEEPVEESTEAKEVAQMDKICHPIEKDSIDYLSVKGIALEPGTEIAMVAANADNSFFDVVKAGAQKAVADLNTELGYTGKDKISFTFTAPENEDVVEQINIIDQFLDKAPDALCIAFPDASASKTQIQMAKNNGIHLIAFDTPDDDMQTEALVSTDNVTAASEVTEKLFEAIDYEGKVAIIVHNYLTKTGQDRKQAVIDTLANKYNDKNIQFVDIVYMAQEDRSESEILDELLSRNPDLAGIICTDLLTTEMVIDYVNKLDEKNFVVAGFDTSKKIVKAVTEGTIIGTMSQDPYGMGYATIITAARSIAGLEKSEWVNSAHYWVNADNLQSEEAQSLLRY